MSAPYYEDDSVTLYHGDCREVLAGFDAASAALVLADPPYGFGVDTAYASRGRGRPSAKSTHIGRSRIASANDYEPVAGDDRPFDPSWLLRFPRLALFGANHYADQLPASPSWLVWDRESGGSATADAELIWTNLGGTIRKFTYQWNGACRAGEKDTHGLHPTQKPVAVMRWIIERYTEPGDLILDPYMGSGPVPAAAKQTGRRAVAVELVEHYCEVAAQRLSQGVLDFAAAAVNPTGEER